MYVVEDFIYLKRPRPVKGACVTWWPSQA